MKLTRSKKIILMIVLAAFVVLLFNSNTVFAAINTEYSGTDTVPDTALESAFDDSSLLKTLAKLVYAVGRFLEWILGTIFKLLTGSSDFPWADKIVFNAVPLLDVNFINPGAGSFLANSNIQDVLKNLYSTIMTLAVGFFGIVVLITAIRLVITTIASEKAKYKQAIVDWLVGFVMLFCIHYFISFVFYLNEQLVIVASKIVKEQLGSAQNVAQVQADVLAKDLIADVRKRNIKYNGESVADILEANPMILTTWMNLASDDTSKGLQEALMKEKKWYGFGADVKKSENSQYETLGMIIKWATNVNVSVEDLTKIKNNITLFMPMDYTSVPSQAIASNDISKMFGYMHYEFTTRIGSGYLHEVRGYKYFNDYWPIYTVVETTESTGVKVDIPVYCEDDKDECVVGNYYVSEGAKEIAPNGYPLSGSKQYATSYYWTDVLSDLIILKGASDTSGGTNVSGSGSSPRLISDLATYFRYNSYSKERRTDNITGVKNGKNIQIQNMIMYTILVAQSLILFIAYVKRLFYVILIAMMGPIVVVFDFFQKFGK